MEYRKLTLCEEKLLEFLVGKSTVNISKQWKDGLLVCSMNDDGMGGLFLYPPGTITQKRDFGEQVSDLQFRDTDGIDVIASLYVDKDGNLLELDIWKTDFNKLQCFFD